MVILKTKGEIEDTIAKKIAQFYFKSIGVGPHTSKVYVLDDMIIARLYGKLLPIEQQLLTAVNGFLLVKDMRKTLHEVTRKHLIKIIQKITDHKVISTHSDISTKTGERLIVFVLDTNYEAELCDRFSRTTVEKV